MGKFNDRLQIENDLNKNHLLTCIILIYSILHKNKLVSGKFHCRLLAKRNSFTMPPIAINNNRNYTTAIGADKNIIFV